jgi:hypothetical protein
MLAGAGVSCSMYPLVVVSVPIVQPLAIALDTDGATAVFATLFVFLRLNYDRESSFRSRIRRVDFSGNAIFIAAIAAVLIALTWGGTIYGWGTFHILVPLILGLAGVLLFVWFEWSPRLCPEPSFPQEVVSNRTSSAALALTFIHAVVAYWVYYFLPIYFQAVKGFSPMQSGVGTLPTFAGGLGFALVGGVVLSKLGRYKPLHFGCYALMTIGFGLFSLLDENSSKAAWVCFQLLAGIGSGGIGGILLPAVQAPLDSKLVGTATSSWSFARYFGCVWGVTIPAAIFNNECSRLSSTISDADVASMLSRSQAYEHATNVFLNSIEDDLLRQEVIDVFVGALRTCWLVGIAFAGLGFLLTFVEKEIELSTELNTEFGIEEKKVHGAVVPAVAVGMGPVPDPVSGKTGSISS